MDLGQKELRLNDAGFSQKEIADWKKQKLADIKLKNLEEQKVNNVIELKGKKKFKKKIVAITSKVLLKVDQNNVSTNFI